MSLTGNHRRVIIESPYSGDIGANTRYARRALRDSIDRGEAPLASHLLYTQVLKDDDPEERMLGIKLGYEHWYGARAIIFYIDRGMSPGMQSALVEAMKTGKDIEFRRIYRQPKHLGENNSPVTKNSS